MLLFLLVMFTLHGTVLADNSLSSLYIKITDATTALKKDDQTSAKELVAQVKEEFLQVANHDSKAGKEVLASIPDDGDLSEKDLVAISKKLLAFEEEQNPVDLASEKEKLVTNLNPRMTALKEAIEDKDLEQIRAEFKKVNASWTANESIVRSNSTGHYGKIETAISFLRSSMEADPVDYEQIQSSYDDLSAALDSFAKGEEVEVKNQNLTLNDGIQLLEDAKAAFSKGDKATGAKKMKEFITIWPSIEGDVSTRNPNLYNRVESQSPVIMVKGEQNGDLTTLIDELSAIDSQASYSFLDAMFILLREGLEAMFIVMALVATLKASKLKKGLVWVYAGALLGLSLSFVIAYVLASFFPTLSGASNREVIEGVVGIIAVLMMVFVGVWLHSKSSIQSWNAFLDKQMKLVTASGSLLSMFALSFLAVFREGAETILFYAGILPKITMTDFALGIGLAVFVLILLAFLMNHLSSHLQPYKLFYWLTWAIYLLSFKMLGVSVHALQLTNHLPQTIMNGLPTIDWLGFYPNWESLLSQLVLILVFFYLRRKNEAQNG